MNRIPPPNARATPRLGWVFTTLLTATFLAGCSVVEWDNPQAAREIARQGQPAGSVYLGWRVFQDRCARCHGADASGGPQAPNLLARVQAQSQREFLGQVLYRYDVTLQAAPGTQAQRPSAAQIELLMQRLEPALVMPNWQGEPRVNAHIQDLYAYLVARASGRQEAGRPLP